MDNKYLVELYVPSISKIYNIFLPVNRRVGNVVCLINKALFELTNGEYKGTNRSCLYDRESGTRLEPNALIRDTSVKNGSGVVIM